MQQYVDKELGTIWITPNKRARNIIARRKSDGIHLTVPHGFDGRKLPAVLDSMRPKLRHFKSREGLHIDEDTVIDTFTFQARIVRTDRMNKVQCQLKEGQLLVFIPTALDMQNKRVQETLKDLFRQVLRHEANRVLPQKVDYWAKKFNLSYNQVKINKSVSRWGSCSSGKNINLSFYLMLLPERMIDYVILHELAHTLEMNHGAQFWELLSNYCGEDARAIGRVVRRFSSPEYDLLKP